VHSLERLLLGVMSRAARRSGTNPATARSPRKTRLRPHWPKAAKSVSCSLSSRCQVFSHHARGHRPQANKMTKRISRFTTRSAGPARGLPTGKWSLPESNRRPPACKAGALPAELRPRKAVPTPPEGGRPMDGCEPQRRARRMARSPGREVVGRGGLEPPTLRLSGVRSNHLSYRPARRSRLCRDAAVRWTDASRSAASPLATRGVARRRRPRPGCPWGRPALALSKGYEGGRPRHSRPARSGGRC
jgi:hypothetical protein